ncbi:MAG: hypothetical protein FWF36_06645 [Propionibacteriaceae bacterium]|nr:hypothetical protein [Propionibacteriaceae bacterium]
MKIVALIAPATWPAVVAAVRRHGIDSSIWLVATDEPPAPLVGPPGALLGRALPPTPVPPELAESAANELLNQAAAALGMPAAIQVLRGPAEQAVIQACADADLLVLARDGDNTRLGPASLSHQTRFIVDHAPCIIELVWPAGRPSAARVPPPPAGRRPPVR